MEMNSSCEAGGRGESLRVKRMARNTKEIMIGTRIRR